MGMIWIDQCIRGSLLLFLRETTGNQCGVPDDTVEYFALGHGLSTILDNIRADIARIALREGETDHVPSVIEYRRDAAMYSSARTTLTLALPYYSINH